MIVLPAVSANQEAAWWALLDLHERIRDDWTLVGGQMVHLWCAERGWDAPRPTDDADAVLDVRASPKILERFTRVLQDLGFEASTSADDVQHRWRRERHGVTASIDVMLPEGTGSRSRSRPGAGGSRTVDTPGGTRALERSETVVVRVGERIGSVRRPDLVGALVVKAAAHGKQPGAAGERHRRDFAVLVSMIAARDLRGVVWTPKDRQRLRAVTAAVRADAASATVPGALASLDRLEDALSR